MRFPRFTFPVLTKAEKTAAAVLILVLSSGAAVRAWEGSGVKLGPVNDWETLRALVIQARNTAGSDTVFPCFEPPPGFSEEHWLQRAQDSTEAKPHPSNHSRSKKMPPANPIDLNVANLEALQSLPGVGTSTAKAILNQRNQNGKFKTVEDLLEVKGIGPKKFEALRKFIRVGKVKTPVQPDPQKSPES